jgi:hypothetical protein
MASSQNFFYRSPTAGGPVDAMGVIGSGLPITEIKNYKFSLNINGGLACVHGGFQGKYQYEQFRGSTTGYLLGASVTIEGTAGSLVRVEAKWKIHRDQLDTVDANYLQIGAKGTVSYSRDGVGGSSASHAIRVYDCSYTINKDNTVDVQVKCIGASQGALYLNLYDNFVDTYGSLQFRADYAESGVSVQLINVSNLVDLIDHTVQSGTGTMTNAAFDPAETCVPHQFLVRYNNQVGDKLFKSEYAFDQDLTMEQTRGVYVTLSWIINKLNGSLRATKIKLIATADLWYDSIGSYIPSANPIECIFNYNSSYDPIAYHRTTKPSKDAPIFYGYNAIGDHGGSFGIENDLGDILINRNVIAGILKENTAIKTSPGIIKMFPLKEYYMTVETFFKKLLAVINANSGGALDLDITIDPEDAYKGGQATGLLIFNNRGKETQPAAYTFKKGMVAIREVSITSKVPSATAAAAFSFDKGSAASIADASDNAGAAAAAGKPQGVASGAPTRDELKIAMQTAAGAFFSSETCDGIRGILRRAVNGEATLSTLKKTSVPWPLELKLTFVGVAGWRFGDTISYNDLPARYRTPAGGIKVGFTTTRVTHTFGDEWTTDLTTQCRFIA